MAHEECNGCYSVLCLHCTTVHTHGAAPFIRTTTLIKSWGKYPRLCQVGQEQKSRNARKELYARGRYRVVQRLLGMSLQGQHISSQVLMMCQKMLVELYPTYIDVYVKEEIRYCQQLRIRWMDFSYIRFQVFPRGRDSSSGFLRDDTG